MNKINFEPPELGGRCRDLDLGGVAFRVPVRVSHVELYW